MTCALLALTLCVSEWAAHSVAPVTAELRAGPAFVSVSALAAEDPDYSAAAGLRWRGLSLGVAVPEIEGDPWQVAPRLTAAVSWRAEF